MINMTLVQIAKACNGRLYEAGFDTTREVAGVVLDSRQVQQDYLFIASVGERFDGHDFIDEVYDQGALAVVCEQAPRIPKGPYILVNNSLTALKDIATWYRMQLDIKVVGITGSVGKTSTKEFISGVLAQRYQVLKTEGNYNNEVGLPLTILKIRDHHEIAVLEMGISDFGEMHRLSEIAKPDICVITNIGQCHLENLIDRRGVLKAKTEIFDFMQENGSVCINGDDDMLATIEEVKGKSPIRFGKGCQNNVYADQIQSLGLFGSTCKIHFNGSILYANIHLPGEHMVLNALAGASVGSLLHMTCEEISAGIETIKPVSGRSNIIRLENRIIIDDCYNANPVSMKAAIDLLAMSDTKKVAILGDMFELGSEEINLHREVGAYTVDKVDLLVCVGKLSLHMYEGAGGKRFAALPPEQALEHGLLYYETREDLLKALPTLINTDDTILVKASHGMGFDQVVNALIN